MKTILSPIRLITLLLCAVLGTSCTTSYDAYGAPQQTVDPGVALMGVAAAGIIGYALASDNHSNSHGHSHSHNNYYNGGHGGYGGGYYSCY